jgi:hypothetical protein
MDIEGGTDWRSGSGHIKTPRRSTLRKANLLLPFILLLQTIGLLYLLTSSARTSTSRDATRQHRASSSEIVHFVGADAAAALTHLIMVPGHAITVGDGGQFDAMQAEQDEAWHLLPYQLQHDVGVTLVSTCICAIWRSAVLMLQRHRDTLAMT